MNGQRYVRVGVCALAVALVALTGTSQAAFDGTLKLDRVANTYSGSGGEFNLSEVTGALVGNFVGGVPALSADSFQSFCVELTERVSPGSTYNYNINTGAVLGSVGGFDPLDAETAYLYTRFVDGSLGALGYNYTVGANRVTSAGALQNAIWHIEEGTALAGGLATTFFNAADAAVSGGTWSGIGNVRVLNLYDGNENLKQDQLVMIPTPAAALMGLPLLGLIGVVRLVRRRKA